jgi:LysM repeat protein
MRFIKFVAYLLIFLLVKPVFGQVPENKTSKEEYIQLYKDIAIAEMNEFGIPASITLAQGILESGNGNSLLAKEAKNHFGIKCHKEWTGKTFHMDDDEANECFRKYEDPIESFKDHSIFLTTRPRYAFLFELEITDYVGWAKGLKSAGYATNPQYSDILIKNIEEFKLYEYDLLFNKDLFDHSPGKPVVQAHKNTGEEEDFGSIHFGEGQHQIYKNNGVKFIYAKKGDTFQSLAKEAEIAEWQIRSFNDLKSKDKINDGQIIYLQAKKSKAKEAYHIVKPGETLYDISQQHAIKLKKLSKYNTLKKDAKLYPDQKLKLR